MCQDCGTHNIGDFHVVSFQANPEMFLFFEPLKTRQQGSVEFLAGFRNGHESARSLALARGVVDSISEEHGIVTAFAKNMSTLRTTDWGPFFNVRVQLGRCTVGKFCHGLCFFFRNMGPLWQFGFFFVSVFILGKPK